MTTHFIKGSTKERILKITNFIFFIPLLLKIGYLVLICNSQIDAVNLIPILPYLDAII